MRVRITSNQVAGESRLSSHGQLLAGMCLRCSPALAPQRRMLDTPLGRVCAPCLEWLRIGARLPPEPPDTF
jgi:hypothetical protein